MSRRSLALVCIAFVLLTAMALPCTAAGPATLPLLPTLQRPATAAQDLPAAECLTQLSIVRQLTAFRGPPARLVPPQAPTTREEERWRAIAGWRRYWST